MRPGLATIAREWGRIGCIGFGGPPAHIALLRQLCVERRGWIEPREGLLFCVGRLDHQVKLHGYRIEIEEIETHLRAVPGVTDGAVVPVERDGTPDHLVALVVVSPRLASAGRALTNRVRAALAECLPAYALPRLVRSTPTLPLTAHGKLDRRALRELAG